MAVSYAPATIEKPLELQMQGTASSEADPAAPGTLLVAELRSDESPEWLAIMATSYQSPPDRHLEQLAIDRLQTAIATDSGLHASDLLKAGFRDANRAIVESGGAVDTGVAMLAMITRGKYATLALVGQDRAYLARAGRLNQLTRDQRVAVARSRRKQDIQDAKSGITQVRLLGEADRLDARSPAIFEIVLLPEDRLALLSHDLIESTGEEAIRAQLNDRGSAGARSLVLSAGTGEPLALMAAVLAAAPAREALHIPTASTIAPRPFWMIVVPVMLLLVIIGTVAFFLL